jgi:hypothetical protein
MQITAFAGRITAFAGCLAFALALAAPLFSARAQDFGPAREKEFDCGRLRAAVEAMPRPDSDSVRLAGQLRVDIDRLAARADAIGCNNQQFLFFGSPPPPECGGVKQRLANMRAQYDSLRVRGGDIGRRQALVAQFREQCGGEPLPGEDPGEAPREAGARGGSEAVCVRKCDGYYFPLTPGMGSGRSAQLRDLCQALCPDAEVGLYSRAPHADIASALAADSGQRYDDLPAALNFTKKLDPTCACKKPNQSWAELLGRAEQILTDIEGERPGEGPLTAQQADQRSHVQPASKPTDPKPAEKPPQKRKSRRPPPPPDSPLDPPVGDF